MLEIPSGLDVRFCRSLPQDRVHEGREDTTGSSKESGQVFQLGGDAHSAHAGHTGTGLRRRRVHGVIVVGLNARHGRICVVAVVYALHRDPVAGRSGGTC